MKYARALLATALVALQSGQGAARGRPPIIAAGRTFACNPIAVWDGDGPIWCSQGPRLRLLNIAAREIDNSCRPGHPCPRASGIAARDRLVALLGGATGSMKDGHVKVHGPQLICRSAGPDRYLRTLASCRSPAGDLGAALISSGAARPWQPHSGN